MPLRYSATTAHRLKPLSFSLWLALPGALCATQAFAANETDQGAKAVTRPTTPRGWNR